jgi:hypothetical protein
MDDACLVPPSQPLPKPSPKQRKRQVSFQDDKQGTSGNGDQDTLGTDDDRNRHNGTSETDRTSEKTPRDSSTTATAFSDTASIISDTPSAMPSEMSMGLDAEHVDHRLFGGCVCVCVC